MDDWKHAVLLTLRQDLFDLTNLAKSMQQTVQYDGLNSWLYPSKSCKDVLKANVSEDVIYTNCLELLIDRIYIIFNLYILYFETKRHKSCGVSRPKKLTLAGCAKSLWNKLSVSSSSEKNLSGERNKVGICLEHAQIQTENESVLNCDSCGVAFKCIKEILAMLEGTLDESSNTAEMKRALHTKIFDISLFACMANLCSAIEGDISFLVRENRRLRETLQTEVEKKSSESESLLEKCEELELANEKIKGDLESLRNENKNLTESNKILEKALMEKEDKFKSCYLQSNNFKNTIDKLSCERENLKKALGTALINNDSLEEQLASCKRHVNAQITELSGSLDDIENNFKKCEVHRARSEECTELMFNHYENVLKNLQETLKNKVVAQKFIEKNEAEMTKDKRKIEVKGNPLDDIHNQIGLNDLKIKSLQLENRDLLSLVSKINQTRRNSSYSH